MGDKEAGGVVARLTPLAPGVALSAAVALAAVGLEAPASAALTALGGRPLTLPAMVLALIVGMALHALALRPRFQPGLTFCVKRLLRIAVALLGIRIALGDIVALGAGTAALVVVAMALTLGAGLAAARAFGRDAPFGALCGGATAVCGASAALAIATVLPRERARNADVVFVVVAVNALSTVAMLAYPPLCLALGFSAQETGILLGATIHDVAQVVGAGYAVSDTVGNSAVIVKLFRVFLLLPVVLVIGGGFAARSGEGAKVPVPGFAIAFLLLVLANSTGLVPAPVKTVMVELSRAGLLIAIGALGLGTSVGELRRAGWPHLAVITATTAVILLAALAGLVLLR